MSHESDSASGVGPCETWPVVWCCDLDDYTPAATGMALEAASEVLWGLSGRQFGRCFVPLRPCRDECDNYSYYGRPEWAGWGWPFPDLVGGRWYNLGCAGSCDGQCGCNTQSQFTLPEMASEIVSIEIDGDVLPPSSYALYNRRYVIRTDGGEWPDCNDLSVESGPGAWIVTAAFGLPVNRIGQVAVGQLACEILKLCAQDDCVLPANARRVTRQGVTVDTPEITDYIAQGRVIGLTAVDLFIATFNPSRLTSRSRSYSVDRPPMRHRS